MRIIVTADRHWYAPDLAEQARPKRLRAADARLR